MPKLLVLVVVQTAVLLAFIFTIYLVRGMRVDITATVRRQLVFW